MNMNSMRFRVTQVAPGRRIHRGVSSVVTGAASAPAAPLVVSKTSQLAQLADMTVLSIDTGDLAIIQRFASTGLITDASESPCQVLPSEP